MKKKNVNCFLAGVMSVMLAMSGMPGVQVAYAAEPDVVAYRDGTYEGIGTGLKGPIKLEVTLKDGKVSEISEKEQHETPDRWESAKGMLARFLGKDYEQADAVDGVSGATFSSNGIRGAVKNAFLKASGDITGSGSWDDPYVIKTVEQLEKFAANVDEGQTYAGQYVALDADLDLAGVKNFNPIGKEDGST
ncbi:MAG: FMN-binding protein [Lachnospiraceae bacterium]|nr:FMN-binding protein [Lachnospiraceae bacterium]